jgi:2-(1,2-epoxy-1,2-dihydrophenyl)acetyl-CoA isomerase
MASYETILITESSGVLTITLNRPEVFNAFNDLMKKELNDALKGAERDREARCVVVRGAGEKAFCSGQDLKEHAGSKRNLRESIETAYNPMIRRIRTMEKPVIAMVNGVAAGAGCSLALACDLRVMAEHAKLVEVFIRIGLIPDSGSHWFLAKMVGHARAFEYMATGRDIPAAEAERVGLANLVVPADRLEARAVALPGADRGDRLHQTHAQPLRDGRPRRGAGLRGDHAAGRLGDRRPCGGGEGVPGKAAAPFHRLLKLGFQARFLYHRFSCQPSTA